MTLFRHGGGIEADTKQCRRDIEAEIKHRRKTMKDTQDFFDACMKYAESQSLYNLSADKFNFAELVGALQLSFSATNREINGLIAEQEALAAQKAAQKDT